MTTGDDTLDAEASMLRAVTHEREAEQLCGIGSEYAAVALFYGAYHRARYALLTDPVFDNPTALSRVNVNLAMGDRTATRHSGYSRRDGTRTTRIWGVNELVSLLYPEVAGDYEVLHQGSIDVRYRTGLSRALDTLTASGQRIREAQADGLMRYTAAQLR